MALALALSAALRQPPPPGTPHWQGQMPLCRRSVPASCPVTSSMSLSTLLCSNKALSIMCLKIHPVTLKPCCLLHTLHQALYAAGLHRALLQKHKPPRPHTCAPARPLHLQIVPHVSLWGRGRNISKSHGLSASHSVCKHKKCGPMDQRRDFNANAITLNYLHRPTETGLCL